MNKAERLDHALGAFPEGKTHAVYRLYDADRQLLYVGLTKSFGRRMSAHSTRSWWPRVEDIFVTFHEDRATAAAVEEREIRERQPQHNSRHHPLEEIRRAIGPVDIAYKLVAPGWFDADGNLITGPSQRRRSSPGNALGTGNPPATMPARSPDLGPMRPRDPVES